jgi:hypothetical protein
MEGPEFSVDAIVHNGEITICGLADRHIFFPPYFIEMGHTMPTSIGEEEKKKILDVFKAGAKALGINNGAAKGDIKLTAKGAMIGEIAARLSGGYMSGWTYPYSSGVLPTKGAIQVAIGSIPDDLKEKRKWTSAERAFISIPGRIAEISGLEIARTSGYIKDVFLRSKVGSEVRFPENNVSKVGNIISLAPDRESAVSSAENAARGILVRLSVPNKETENFLSVEPSIESSRAFPPDSFALPEALYPLLKKLPESEPFDGEDYSDLSIYPFEDFMNSGIKDYTGRSVEESLNAVRQITGLRLTITKDRTKNFLGRHFWSALIRGGYQGAAYVSDVFTVFRNIRDE